jgi:antitoxin (DNA-binding transcriptional repressor) of toxin-antitoxin stability system
MTVSHQYAGEHFADLVSAVESGQDVRIERPGKPSLLLVVSGHVSAEVPKKSRRGLVGSGKGKIWMADDWDSPETNDEIAHLFNDGPIFPDEK